MEVQCVKPQTRDQSNKIRISKDYKWSIELTTSSKVGLLHSHQTNHIKHATTKLQTLEECFPNHFCHLSRKDATFSCITHWIPNIRKTSLHNAWENSQWSKRCSTISPQHWQSTHAAPINQGESPLNKVIDCKNLELLPIKKNNTLLRPFTLQMLFHGKEAGRQPKI